MKKRMASCLLSFIMAILFISGSAQAASFDEGEDFTGASEMAEETPAGRVGFYQPIYLDLPADELPEVFKEPVDRAGFARGSAAYRSAWDSYSSNYYYNLLNDNQRALWDKLDAMCYSYLTGNKTFTGRRRYTNLKAGLDLYYYMTESVLYTGLSENEARDLEYMFVVSNPQYYFLQTMLMDATQLGTGGYAYLTINETFANGDVRKSATQNVQSKINGYLAEVNKEPTPLLKEKRIHDLICENMLYDQNFGTTNQNKYNQTIYSVFFTDTTVCAGYSQAMALLCNAAGIDCVSVTSEEHEWNMVRLNGAWYYVDCTWDDNIADAEGLGSAYTYFNRSRQKFLSDTPYAVRNHTAESRWNGYLPDLIYDSGADKTNHGTIYVPSSSMAQPVIAASGDTATITSPSGGAIYYTVNGSNPSVAYTKARRYTGPIVLKGTSTVRAIAVRAGYFDSAVAIRQITPAYAATFNAAGGYIGKKSVQTQTKTVAYNQKIGKLPTPKRKGYAFLGWFTKRSGGSKIDASLAVKASQTYYAHWAKIKKIKNTAVSSAKSPSAGTLKIKIKKNSAASGYQIRYSLKKNMSSSKKKLISENSHTVKKLKKGRTYYVQARAYQKDSVSGKKTYGSWSKVKTVKIKKK